MLTHPSVLRGVLACIVTFLMLLLAWPLVFEAFVVVVHTIGGEVSLVKVAAGVACVAIGVPATAFLIYRLGSRPSNADRKIRLVVFALGAALIAFLGAALAVAGGLHAVPA